MPVGKKIKQLVAQHHRAPSQASGSRPPQPRPPAERVLRRLKFPNPEHSKYVWLGFYPDRGHRAFFELGAQGKRN